MEMIVDTKSSCNYVCDITNGAKILVKMMSKAAVSKQPSICDVKIFLSYTHSMPLDDKQRNVVT